MVGLLWGAACSFRRSLGVQEDPLQQAARAGEVQQTSNRRGPREMAPVPAGLQAPNFVKPHTTRLAGAGKPVCRAGVKYPCSQRPNHALTCAKSALLLCIVKGMSLRQAE